MAALSIGAACSTASAEERRGYTPEPQQTRIGVEIDFLHTSGKTPPLNLVTNDVVAQIGVTRHVFLDAGISAGLIMGKEYSAGVFGNPMIGAHYAGWLSGRTSGFVGLAVGIPVAGASSPDLADMLGAQATAVRAWHDPYRFLPHTFPVVARAGLEVALAPAFLRFELSPGVMVDLRDGTGLFYADVSAEAGLRARFGLEGGLRGQGTFVVADTDDHAQTAIEPFIGYATSGRVGFYARYGLLVALDTPLGPAGEGLVTHRLAVGAKL